LIAKVAASNVGQNASLTFLREVDGKLERRTTTATLADRDQSLTTDPEVVKTDKPEKEKSNTTRLGLTLAELTPKMIDDNRLNGVKGLYVKDVDPNGLVADLPDSIRVQEGEVITRINRIPVSTLADFQHVIESLKPGDAIVLNLSRYYRPQTRVTNRIVQFTYQ
jgi:S1-C subfamily serine protease